MNPPLETLPALFRSDLPRAPGALSLAAATGWCLLLPTGRGDPPLAGSVLLVLVVLWQHWLSAPGSRPSRWAVGFALLCLVAVGSGDMLSAGFAGWSGFACGLALLPVAGRALPPLGRGHPRPALARVLLPLLSPLVLGSVLMLYPGMGAQAWLPVLLETTQLVALLSAGALLLIAPDQDWQNMLVLVTAKLFSTLVLPWWLLHAYPDRHVAWLLALVLLVEGEWESRILLALADPEKEDQAPHC